MENKQPARKGNAATSAAVETKNHKTSAGPILSGYPGLDNALRVVNGMTSSGLPWCKNPDALRDMARAVAEAVTADMEADGDLLRAEAEATDSPCARLAFKLAERIARDHAARYRYALGVGAVERTANR